MQLITRANDIKTSTRKVRLIGDSIRKLGIFEALDALSIMNKKAARDLEKVLKSAVANAQNNFKLEKNNLRIKEIDINEGMVFKRYRPSTRGRTHPYKKKTTNIRIILEEKIPVAAVGNTEVKSLPKGESKTAIEAKTKEEKK